MSLNALNKNCVCVRVYNMIISQFMLWWQRVGGGGKQISNPQSNPSSCSDYKSAGALRSNQQEQSAAGTDTLSIKRGPSHCHTCTLTPTKHTHSVYTFLQPQQLAHTLGHNGRCTACCSSTFLPFCPCPLLKISKFLFALFIYL